MSRKPSQWIAHVKAYASKNSITYKKAMQSPECKSSYTKTGGSVLSKMKSGFKKAGTDISKATKKTVDYVKNDAGTDIKSAYGEVNQFALKNDVGGKIQMVKNAIPPQVTQMLMQDALIAGGVDPVSAGVMAGSATGAVYSVDFSKSLKGQGDNALHGAIQGGAQGATSAYISKKRAKGQTGAGFSDNVVIDEDKLKRAVAKFHKKGGSFIGGSFVGGDIAKQTRAPFIMKFKEANNLSQNIKDDKANGGSFKGSGYNMSFSGGSFKGSGSKHYAIGSGAGYFYT